MWGIAATASTRTAPRNLDFNFDVQETGGSSVLWPGVLGWEPPCEGCGRGFLGHEYACIRLASPGLVGRGQPFLPEKSHVISFGQFLMCLENVGIATTRFQSLNNWEGNYVRHLWRTMRVTVGVGGCAGVWCVEAGAGPAGPGRASRSITPSRRLACGDLAGGQAPRGPQA